MKQKRKNYVKFGILMLGILFLLQNCQKDTFEEIVLEENGKNSFFSNGKLDNYKPLQRYVEELQEQQQNSFNAKDSFLEEQHNFTLLEDQDISVYTGTESSTYTLSIEKENQPQNTFSNLVVHFKDNHPTEAFIVNYEPFEGYLEAYAEDKQTPFSGNTTYEAIDYDGSLDDLNKNCTSITLTYCNWGGETHSAGENCTASYMWNVTYIYCPSSPVFISEPNSIDAPSGMSGGGGSTGGGGGTTATPNDTTPDSLDDDCLVNSNGDCINDPVTYPLPTVNEAYDIYDLIEAIDLNQDQINWLNDNLDFKNDMLNFYNEEQQFNHTEREIKLMIRSETSDVPWTNETGTYNNVPNLNYTRKRFMAFPDGHIYTEYELTNEDRIISGDFSTTSEFDERTYYYHRDMNTPENQRERRLFEIPDPYNQPEDVNIDLLFETFWSGIATGLRYCTPIEDVIILIDGKDFEGNDQSQAVAGLFILVDFIPGGKVFKITKRAGQVLGNSAPILRRIATSIYKMQRKQVNRYKGIIATMSNARKGNWSEMVTDTDWIEKGYKELHVTRVTNIDDAGHQGIDHVFKNEVTGEYIIVESKYTGSASLNPANPATGLPRQMSDAWIHLNNNNSRLINALDGNANLANDILNNGYQRVLAKVHPDGTITHRLIDSNGYVILGNAGNFTP